MEHWLVVLATRLSISWIDSIHCVHGKFTNTPEDPKRVNIFLATRSKVLNGGARSKRLQLLGTEGWHRLVRRVSLSVDINNI